MPPFEYLHGALPYPASRHVVPTHAYTPTTPKKPQQNGTVPKQSHSPPQPPAQASPKPSPKTIRPLNVNEALQFSPFSSIVPFDSSIVSLPNAQISASQSIFSDLSDNQRPRRQLEYLDSVARHGDPQIVRTTLGSVQSLLDPMKISEFKFRSRPTSLGPHDRSGPAHPSETLSPFAAMVLEHTDVTYSSKLKFPTGSTGANTSIVPDASEPSSPQSIESTGELKPTIQVQIPKRPMTPPTPSPSSHNQQAVAQNEATHVSMTSALPSQSPMKPAVLIADTQLSSHPDQYRSYENASQTNSRKRKRSDTEDRETNDQRAVANAALQSLKEVLWEIFETEDDFDASADGLISNNVLTSVRGSDGDLITITRTANVKLESSLHKAISLGKFKSISVEDITRIQKLSMGGIIAAESLDGRIESGWGDDDAASWLESIEVIETAFRSARTILRTMTGGREEKHFYSEELLQGVITLLTKVTDSCLVRVVESRSSGDSADVFRTATANTKVLSHLLHSASKVMNLLLEIVSREEFAEKPINDILFFVIRLLFVENSPSEKDSVFGIHKFEAFRRTATNIISQIFARYGDQREFIIREVLESLQKLPTGKQHARQYKLPDGRRLQLTSVLLIRLVSTSGTPGLPATRKKSRRLLPDLDDVAVEDGDEDGRGDPEENDSSDDDQPLSKTANSKYFMQEKMRHLARDLYDAASHSAQKIINFLVFRASTCSKTGEQPHRHLLDMFVEDLVAVLSLPEWPAAELLLRALVGRMIEVAESSQSLAPAKNMALEILGIMGCAILDVTAKAKQTSRTLETDDSKLSEQLSLQLENISNGVPDVWELAGRNGPYRMILEHLSEIDSDVQGYHLSQWIKFMFWGYNATSSAPHAPDISYVPFATRVCKALADGKWADADDHIAVSLAQCKLAYHLVLLNVAVCRAFGRIVSVLVGAFKSDQVTVRARSLKSVTQMLEKDPSLIDRTPQINHVLSKCVADPSPLVRDSALSLLGKCITFKANIDPDLLKSVLAGTRDTALGIKKRAMKLLKEIYLRETNKHDKSTRELKVVISESLLQRVDDAEESISELAREMLGDIWMSTFWTVTKSADLHVQDKVALKAHMELIVQVVERSELNFLELRRFLKYTMSSKCKAQEANTGVNRALVLVGFESMIDEADDPDSRSQCSILQTLTVYAQANPRLFTQQQLEYLKPYVGNLSGADDLNLFRRVVVILRCVLPTLPTVQKEFLKGVQDDLFKNVAKLAKAELNEVAACLWTINGVLENVHRLVNLEISVLNNLHQMDSRKFKASTDPKDPMLKAQRLIYLAGHFGHHCHFQPEIENFNSRLTWLREDTVPGKIVAAFKPFFGEDQPLSLRTVAMEGIGMVCQAWPQNFNDPSNVDMFKKILRNEHPDLQKIVLSCFRNFFASQDPQFSLEENTEEKTVLIDGKIGGSVIASDKDSAAALIAQGFVQDVIRISLHSDDDYALAATEVMASIVRQGLVHPKDCGPALVALTTSANAKIAAIALQQHQTLHLQHESMFEREYMRAIHLAYEYQKDVAGNSRGFVRPSIRAKLHPMYEVIKTSKSKVQTKFLSNYCSKIDFEVAKLDVASDPPPHLEYARFLIENLALFDYARMEDLLQVIGTCEKIVSNTGSAVAHAINTDVFKMIIDPETGVPLNAVGKGEVNLDLAAPRLRLLTTASMILSMLWQARTFIRRLYNINNKDNRKEGRGRPSKDQNKIPPKNNLVSGERLAEAVDKIWHALESRDLCVQQCKEFADLMSIDSELKVAEEGDEEEADRLQTPSADGDENSTIGPGSATKVAKRKGSVSLNGTPVKKKRGRPPLNGARRNSRKSIDEDDDWE